MLAKRAVSNCIDADHDGYSTCQHDCDDGDPAVHPGAPERCDGKDDSCDGVVDEGCACTPGDLPRSCGVSGSTCTQTCTDGGVLGACLPASGSGDLATDAQNCGTCGRECTVASCIQGACACSSDADCESSERCAPAGVCLPAGDACSIRDCPAGTVCRTGNCQVLGCTANADCGPGEVCDPTDTCRAANDPCSTTSCPESTVCRGGACQVQGCATDDDCAGNERCGAGGICRVSSDACASSACATGTVCRAGSCTAVSCTADASCEQAERCAGGLCVPDPDGCRGTSCAFEKVCRAGSCEVVPCQADAGSCEMGESCAAGACVPSGDPCASASCAPGEVCRAPDGGASCAVVPCTGAGDCAAAELCGQGLCRAATDPCGTIDTCPDGQVCRALADGGGGCGAVACSGDGDCASGESCGGGFCRPPGDPCGGVVCAAPAPCHQPGLCSGGTCSYAVDPGAACDDGDACTSSDTCDATGTCQGGAAKVCDTPGAACLAAAGTCDPSSGACSYPPLDAGVACTDDANPCTADLCDGAGGCGHAALADGTRCGVGSVCESGACVTAPLPLGLLVPYVGAAIPSGWLVADGSAVSRTAYPELFAALGTRYGAGDGSTTFNLPDLRGRSPLGDDGSSLGASGGALSPSGTVNLGAFTYGFSWTDTAPNPAFSAHTFTWNGAGAGGAATGGSYRHTNISPVTFTTTESGSVATANVSASGSASATANYSVTSPPYAVVRYLVMASPSATPPDCALWAAGNSAAPAGSIAADGSAASGTLAGCLDPAYAGSLPDLRGAIPLGQDGAGPAATLGASGGALSQTATISYAANTGRASVTPSWTVAMTISSPAPSSLSYANYDVTELSGSSGFGSAGSATVGSDNGHVVASSTYSPGTLTSTGPSGSATSSAFSLPFLAVEWLSYTAAGYAPSPGVVMPFAGASVPAQWLAADGACYATSTYPDLFAAIGYTFGGSGASFCVPDMRSRFPLGKAASGTASTLGATGGTLGATPSATLAGWTPQLTIPSHTLSWSVPNHTHNVTGNRSGGSLNGTGPGSSVTIARSVDCAGNQACNETYASVAGGAQTVSSTAPAATASATAIGSQVVTLPAIDAPHLTVGYIIKY